MPSRLRVYVDLPRVYYTRITSGDNDSLSEYFSTIIPNWTQYKFFIQKCSTFATHNHIRASINNRDRAIWTHAASFVGYIVLPSATWNLHRQMRVHYVVDAFAYRSPMKLNPTSGTHTDFLAQQTTWIINLLALQNTFKHRKIYTMRHTLFAYIHETRINNARTRKKLNWIENGILRWHIFQCSAVFIRFGRVWNAGIFTFTRRRAFACTTDRRPLCVCPCTRGKHTIRSYVRIGGKNGTWYAAWHWMCVFTILFNILFSPRILESCVLLRRHAGLGSRLFQVSWEIGHHHFANDSHFYSLQLNLIFSYKWSGNDANDRQIRSNASSASENLI